MRKARSQHLLEKSIHAAVSAIEIYNKPDFKYREESFPVFMVNAWKRRHRAAYRCVPIEYEHDSEAIRKDCSCEKGYIRGRYGAIPYLGNLSEPMSQWQEKQKLITPS
ncbi:MAG: hypothetical protein NW241_02435 [Bacteroidia bacterium]|nr:hypothetical protein [Bacteroidia bacterium]